MVKRLSVKGFISLSLVLFAYYFSSGNSTNKQIKAVANKIKKNNYSKKVNPFSDTELCLTSLVSIKSMKKTNKVSEVHWKNFHLKKENQDFVFRVQRDSNLQGQEVRKIKFYKLDREGFPTPINEHHNKILNINKNVNEYLKGYSIVTVQTLESYRNEQLMFETQDKKIFRIKDQAIALDCKI